MADWNASDKTPADLDECMRLINERFNVLEGQVTNIETDVTLCKKDNKTLFKTVASLEKRQRKNESYSKRINVIVTNLITNQDLKDMNKDELKDRMVEFVNTTVLGQSVPRYQIPAADFIAVHKLGLDERGPYSPMIIQFTKEEHVIEMLKNANKGVGHINQERKNKAAENATNGGNGNPRCISIRQHKDEITTTMYSYLSWAKRLIIRNNRTEKCVVRHEGKRQDPVMYYKNSTYTVYNLPNEVTELLPIEYSHDFKVPKGPIANDGDSRQSRKRDRASSVTSVRSSSRIAKRK